MVGGIGGSDIGILRPILFAAAAAAVWWNKWAGRSRDCRRGGVFVVVVVVVADKDCGTPSGTSCCPAAAQGAARRMQGRQKSGRLAQTMIFLAGRYAVVKMRASR
ncbi:MAG: hypothetical protein J0L63_10510 [Anaerolineae bacterium]|nr:hypothetical protein [Anaerolineae bacterium]